MILALVIASIGLALLLHRVLPRQRWVWPAGVLLASGGALLALVREIWP